MKKDLKLYQVTTGYLDKSGDGANFDSVNVLAHDALEAAGKVKPGKREYISQIVLLNHVEIP